MTHSSFSFSPPHQLDRKPPWDTNFTIAANVSAFSAFDWTPRESSIAIELWESSGVLCLIELLWRAAAPYVFSLIELFLGPVEAGSARQSPLIFLNDVASVSVNLHAAAARRGLLWLTSPRDKQSSLLYTDEGRITSILPKNISATSERWEKVNKYIFIQSGRSRIYFVCYRFYCFDFPLLCWWQEEHFEKSQRLCDNTSWFWNFMQH